MNKGRAKQSLDWLQRECVFCVTDLEEADERNWSVHSEGSAGRKRGEEEDKKERGCQASQRVKIGTRQGVGESKAKRKGGKVDKRVRKKARVSLWVRTDVELTNAKGEEDNKTKQPQRRLNFFFFIQ